MRTLILVAFIAAPLGAAELRAGVAKADLDPPLGIPMAGYGPTRFSKGTLDALEARVLTLADGKRTIAFVTLDLCFTFNEAAMDQIRGEVRGTRDRGPGPNDGSIVAPTEGPIVKVRRARTV